VDSIARDSGSGERNPECREQSDLHQAGPAPEALAKVKFPAYRAGQGGRSSQRATLLGPDRIPGNELNGGRVVDRLQRGSGTEM
jgi:hypothetical protein